MLGLSRWFCCGVRRGNQEPEPEQEPLCASTDHFPSPDTIITAPKPSPRLSSIPPHERLRSLRDKRDSYGSTSTTDGGPSKDDSSEGKIEQGAVGRRDSHDRLNDIGRIYANRMRPLSRPPLHSSPPHSATLPPARHTGPPNPFTMVPVPRTASTVPVSPAGKAKSAGRSFLGQSALPLPRTGSVTAPPSARMPPLRDSIFHCSPPAPTPIRRPSSPLKGSLTSRFILSDVLHRRRQTDDPTRPIRHDPPPTSIAPHYGRSVSEPHALHLQIHRRLSDLQNARSRSTSASALTSGQTSPSLVNGMDSLLLGRGPTRPTEIEGFAAHQLPMGRATDPRTVMIFRGRPRSNTNATDRSVSRGQLASCSSQLLRDTTPVGTGPGDAISRPKSLSRPASDEGRRRTPEVMTVHNVGWEEGEASHVHGEVPRSRGYPGVSARRGRSPGPSRLGSRNVSDDSLHAWRMEVVAETGLSVVAQESTPTTSTNNDGDRGLGRGRGLGSAIALALASVGGEETRGSEREVVKRHRSNAPSPESNFTPLDNTWNHVEPSAEALGTADPDDLQSPAIEASHDNVPTPVDSASKSPNPSKGKGTGSKRQGGGRSKSKSRSRGRGRGRGGGSSSTRPTSVKGRRLLSE